MIVFRVCLSFLYLCWASSSLAQNTPNVAADAQAASSSIMAKVGLSTPAKRVVALAPHLVEALYTVGSGSTLVAAVAHSDYPKAALEVPRVGNYTSINLEALLRLEPDLVLAWGSGNGPKIIAKLKSLGVPVYVSEPGDLASIASLLSDVGELTAGRDTQRVVSDFLNSHNTLKARYQSKRPISVFYQVWNKPLQTLSDKSIVSDVIKLCGGRNVFGQAKAIAPQVSVESVLRENPEVIVASGMGEERPQWLDDWKQWQSLQAVERRQLFFVPPDLIQRHSIRLLEGAEILCAQLDGVRAKKLLPVAIKQQ